MKPFLSIIFSFILTCHCSAQFNFQRSWGTYLGDERFEFGDSGVDSEGNLYIVGTVNGSDLTNLLPFTNADSYQPEYGGGFSDGFIIKLNPSGAMVWGTFFGGEEKDRITAITFDNDDNLYVLGITSSREHITTAGSFQEVHGGGARNAFMAKFLATGSLQWSTYYGGEGADGSDHPTQKSSISFDGNNAVYAVFDVSSPNLATEGAFQTTLYPENMSSTFLDPELLVKFDLNGNRLWATYYGIHFTASVEADENSVYVAGFSYDCPPREYNTYYGTANAFMPEPGNCKDVFLTRFSPTGERLWSTYYGGYKSGEATTEKRAIALKDDTVFIAGIAPDYDNHEIATPGAYQENGLGFFVANFNADGTRNWGTYNGLNIDSAGGNNAGLTISSILSVQESSNFYHYGVTDYSDNIATEDAYQPTKNDGDKDAFICKFRDQNIKLWGTYYGGELAESNVSFHPYDNGSRFYIVGETRSFTQIASENGFQTSKSVFDTSMDNEINAFTLFVAHFEPESLSIGDVAQTDFSIFPNPNDGTFVVKFNGNGFESTKMELFNVLGQKIHSQILDQAQTTIKTQHIEKGLYFAVLTKKGQSSVSKVVIE